MIKITKFLKIFRKKKKYEFSAHLKGNFWRFLIFYFTNGGLSGLILSNFWLDAALHDTYFIVGHFHFVLSIGALLGVIFGVIFIAVPATLNREISFLFLAEFFVFAGAVFLIFIRFKKKNFFFF